MERVLGLPKCNVHIVSVAGSFYEETWRERAHKFYVIKPENYHVASKALAENCSRSDIYVVMDDDQLLYGQDFLSKGEEVLRSHPQYGMLSAHSINRDEVPCGAKDLPDCDADVWRSDSIGCPYFVRKGIITVWPDVPPLQFDTLLTKHILEKDYLTGFFHNVRYNHIGSHFSQLGKEHGFGWLA
jgi:hypothetical protein